MAVYPINAEGVGRSQQYDYNQLATEHAFGIYRPLTVESATQLSGTLTSAMGDIQEYLVKRGLKHAIMMKPRTEFGVTFLSKHRTATAVRQGLLDDGFPINTVVRELGEFANEQPEDVVLPLGRMDWVGDYRRLLIFGFKQSAGLKRLQIESQEMRDRLEAANGTRLRVFPPDHLTTARYCRHDERSTLSKRHRKAISHIVATHFRRQDIASITLDRPVVGDAYRRPYIIVPMLTSLVEVAQAA
jgi:hypothetical protein